MLLQPRWIAGHLLVLVLVVLFVRLGFWQLDRHAQHRERNARIEARIDAPAVPLGELLGAFPADRGGERSGGGEDALGDASPAGAGAGGDDADHAVASEDELLEASLPYRRVVVEGRFDPDAEVLLRSRTFRGQPGWHVLTPLVLEDGLPNGDEPIAVLVDRGWVPQGFDEPPVAAALPPDGRVRVEGVLAPEQDPPAGPLARFAAADPEQGRLDRAFLVDVERLAPQMPYALAPAYLIPTDLTPPHPADLPVPPEPPGPETAAHLAYAVQWFIFAAIGVVGYGILLRHRLREHRAEGIPDGRSDSATHA